ncbi:hypothetical protein JCM33374_g1109 [Metschnikowia sp. JCM 33374]|nr:hypothetical protein JCM33374_g1109 [Metschnikowia sp. JCM 33374]
MDADDSGNAHSGQGIVPSFGSQRRASQLSTMQNGTVSSSTAPNGVSAPMSFDLNFGLASSLKDPATFSYDDPLLYENLNVTEHPTQQQDSSLEFSMRGTGVEPNAWDSSNWSMPGAFKPSPEDAMDVDMDSSPSFDPNSLYDSTPGAFPGETPNFSVGIPNGNLRNDPRNASANGSANDSGIIYDRFQFPITEQNNAGHDFQVDGGASATTGDFGFFNPENTPHALMAHPDHDLDIRGSYISQDLSPSHNQHHKHHKQNGYGHYNYASLELPESQVDDSASLYHLAPGFSPFGANKSSTSNNDFDDINDMNGSTHLQGDPNMYVSDSRPSFGYEMTDPRDSVSHRTSISVANNELSPLTTTTSFTPSATSLHSTQQSYFSAQQFLRSSIDQPPSSINRASADFYSRRRLSVESSNSGPHVPVRPQRSLASYFHFRDRDRKSPMSRGHSPASADWPQSQSQLSQPRHSIRSIFKTNNLVSSTGEHDLFPAEPEQETVPPNFIAQDMVESQGQFSDIEGSAPKKNEPKSAASSTNKGYSQLVPPGSSSKATTSSLHNIDSAGSANGENSQEPDYAALFTGVGKRRNLVSIKSKKKTDSTIKTESCVKIEGDGDKIALNPSISNNEYSGDCVSAGSVPHSSNSHTSKESNQQDQASSSGAFANASKRILGSRLMKKKNNVKSEPASDGVVEVDLQSLDLPENIEILSNPSLLNKTRGRKEDKAADMEDQSKIFVCGFCDRRFKRQEHLKRHFRSLHTAEKPYDCHICQKKFSRTDNLNQHLKVHKQEEEQAALNSEKME